MNMTRGESGPDRRTGRTVRLPGRGDLFHAVGDEADRLEDGGTLAGWDEDLRQVAGDGRVDVEDGLIGLDAAEGLALLDPFAFLLVPRGDRALVHGLAELEEHYFGDHIGPFGC